MLDIFNNKNFFIPKEEFKENETSNLHTNQKEKSSEELIIYDYIQSVIEDMAVTLDLDSIKEDIKNLNGCMKLSYNKNIIKDLEDYFILEISNDYDPDVYPMIGIHARNLITKIITTRRKVGYFKLKLSEASMSEKDRSKINFTFISVDENGEPNEKAVFRRRDSDDIEIIINR